ncbi:MAG: hypothetical protein QF552_04225 [Litorilituus sp.]|jgi:hypothetical protein|nr:hypothetical protein [Litorilituus sp.]
MTPTCSSLPKRTQLTLAALLSLGLSLAGCNGGSTKATNNVNFDIGEIVQIDDSVLVGQSAELVLFFPDASVTNINWQQTAGETVPLLTKANKVIAFTPQLAGDYTFDVSFSLNSGASKTLSHTITVEEQNNKVATRLAHSVLSDNSVSLRSFTDVSIEKTSIKWEQLSGPTINFSENDPTGDSVVFFTAPQVTKDTILSFEVTASDGVQTYNDKVMVLVEPAAKIAENAYFDERVANVLPYNSTSPYAENLVDCVYSNTLTSSCTLAKLPLLAAESSTPTITNIMDRVVVSHQWMGDRFKAFMINNDDNNDFKHLLRATTAIVISYDVRPSFYWAATGAIYLDAKNFWLTPDERDTINEAPDYRSDFGKDLQFVMPWRYVKDNDYADDYFAVEDRLTRTTNDGFYRLASLLYHELAHANDFFPSNEWFTHSLQTRILDAATSTNFESDGLSITHPLQSSNMESLAQVSFKGSSATSIQKSYLPTDIEQFFSPDVANDYYAYSSEREDYAMLFEELMMQSRFQVFRDVAITNQPTGNNISARDYIVTWGQRGRIGADSIKPRVLYTASRVLPEFDSSSALTQIPTPIAMIEGGNWLDNLTISPSNLGTSQSKKNQKPIARKNQQRPLPNFYFQKELPKN